ncbi:hypothetical protein J2786_002631 [Chryseobacterium vietnamense]|uniref:Uncharacterized protein n=1 Tax=Chryseobacterium vietnamense TaxID=866785 RepID=A0ACC6J9K9_9FLAO|nr:hypothetical protein [Chryseobacterium vietnamense]
MIVDTSGTLAPALICFIGFPTTKIFTDDGKKAYTPIGLFSIHPVNDRRVWKGFSAAEGRAETKNHKINSCYHFVQMQCTLKERLLSLSSCTLSDSS